MTTRTHSIFNINSRPEGGDCYFNNIVNEMTLTTFPGEQDVLVFKDPSADVGIYGTFEVPAGYIDTANILLKGLLRGTVSTTVAAFEFNYRSSDDNESIEQAWQETKTFNTGNTNGWSDEDWIFFSAALVDGNFSPGDMVSFYLARDVSEDTFVGNLLVADAFLQYNDV